MPQITKVLSNGGFIIKSDEGIYAYKCDSNSLPLILDKEEGERLFEEGKIAE